MAREQLMLNAQERGREALRANRASPGALFSSASVLQSSLGASRNAVNEGRDAIFSLYRDGRIGRLFNIASDSRNDAGLRDYARNALEQIVSKTAGVNTEWCRTQFYAARTALMRLQDADRRVAERTESGNDGIVVLFQARQAGVRPSEQSRVAGAQG